jgi:hypothetical protein
MKFMQLVVTIIYIFFLCANKFELEVSVMSICNPEYLYVNKSFKDMQHSFMCLMSKMENLHRLFSG